MSSSEIPPAPNNGEGEDTPESAGEVVPETPALPAIDAEELQRHAREEGQAASERDQAAREEVLARLRGEGDDHPDEIIDAEFSDIDNSLPVPYDYSITRVTDEELIPRPDEDNPEPPPRRRRRTTRRAAAENQEQLAPAVEPEANPEGEGQNENRAEENENQAEEGHRAEEEPHPEADHDEHVAHAEHAPHEHGHHSKPMGKREERIANAILAGGTFAAFGLGELFVAPAIIGAFGLSPFVSGALAGVGLGAGFFGVASFVALSFGYNLFKSVWEELKANPPWKGFIPSFTSGKAKSGSKGHASTASHGGGDHH